MAKKENQSYSEQVFIFLFLRLYGHAVTRIADHSFMSPIVCRRVKQELKKNKDSKAILRHPSPMGAAYYTAVLAIDDFFHNLMEPKQAVSSDDVDFLDELLSAWVILTWPKCRLADRFGKRVEKLQRDWDGETDLDKEAMLLIDVAQPLRIMIARACLNDPFYPRVRHLYGLAIADRLLHDREISAHIALNLVSIAPKDRDGHPTVFVKRVEWPAFVKPLLMARDRGKCSICKTDIAAELLADAHIDHIHPLAFGGCNDVVNLQLSCDACNLKKGKSFRDVRPSVPEYHRKTSGLEFEDAGRQSPFSIKKRPYYAWW